MKAPKAEKKDTLLVKFGDTRIDPYFWLNQRDQPKVLDYLKQENLFSEEVMKDTEELQALLFEEMKSRYKKDDESIPYFFNQYWYIVKEEEGKEYPVFYRKHLSLNAPEELIIDANILAAHHAFFDIGGIAASPDNQLASYSTDTVGRRLYTIRFKDLRTNMLLADEIPATTGKVVWAADSKHIFYIKRNKSLRAFKVFRHQLGTSVANDVLVYHEKDTSFDVNLQKTKSQKYIFIVSSSTLSEETRFIPADDIFAPWQIIQPRTSDLEYAVEHFKDEFYIITNADQATNFKLVKTKVTTPEKAFWEEVIPAREDVLLEGFEIFNDFLVLEERKEGLLQIKIIENSTGKARYLRFSDPTYAAFIGLNLEFNTEVVRYEYTSLTTPASTFEYNMKTHATYLIKQQEITGGKFDAANYVSERIWALSRDGKTKIPVSLVYHKNTIKSQETPLLLYGYGSYGLTVDAGFSRVRLSLLDRGFIFAIAHVRGGEYLGRKWYEDGKMLHKKNTFFDFLDAAHFLVDQNYTSPRHLYASGGSAGGLLMGAVINEEPELFHGVIADVPFVDVVTTMLDESIPLTTGEYDEWGNPNEEAYYQYMKSYSPYDNVKACAYPHLLVTTGLHDSQVQYWEPAKWVAKLRDLKTDHHILLLKTDMSSGHGGASGRFESLKEDALDYAFLLKIEKED